MNTTALFVGSFDPFHQGHQDIVARALTLFPRIVIGIGINPDKHYSLSTEERLRAIKRHYADEPRVQVVAYDDKTVDLARRVGATCIVKGVRNAEDYAYEARQAVSNRQATGIETLLLPADPALADISSTKIKQSR